MALAYVCEEGPATYVARAVLFDRSDLKTAFLLGGEIYDLAHPGETAAPDVLLIAPRVN